MKISTKIKSKIRKLLANSGYEIRKYPRVHFTQLSIFDEILIQYLQKNEKIFFIQIGGNDGVLVDPLNKYYSKNDKWHGVIFEPNPAIFEKLLSNIHPFCQRIQALNKGVSSDNGKILLWIPRSTLEENYSPFASFSKNIVKKQVPKDICIDALEVEIVSLNSFIEMNNVDKIDVLQIDTEGHEYEILKNLGEWSKKPSILHIEIGHLTLHSIDQLMLIISAQGYRSYWGGHQEDLVCVL